MAVQFTCPYCGWTTEVAARYAGRSGDCASCGKPIEVPAAKDAKGNLKRKARSQSGSSLIYLAGVLALVLLAGVVFFGGLGYLALNPTQVPLMKRAPNAGTCAANLKKIGAAITAFVEENGHFPAAYTVNESGVPMHSWRVQILPFMGYDSLYDQLRLEEPWDSPHNQRFADQMPIEYRCPADNQAVANETNYFVVTSPDGVFEADKTTKPDEVVDGLARTLLVVEGNGLGVNWLQPIDIDSVDLIWNGGASYRGIGSMHMDERYFVITADGNVSAIDPTTSMDELRAMMTMAGAEQVYPALAVP